MRGEIQNFIHYLQTVKNAATNTVVSYERDLRKMSAYMAEQGISTAEKVTSTTLNAYVLYLEQSGMSTATISRTVATLRRFFDYQCKHGDCAQDPSELLKAPKVERKPTHVATEEELQQILALEGKGAKQLRDRAMVLAMCQGIRATELIHLNVSDINLDLGYMVLKGEKTSRTVGISARLDEALRAYLGDVRQSLLKGHQTDVVFVNCNGGSLSRQGVWKVVKHYGELVGVPELTPDGLRMPAE